MQLLLDVLTGFLRKTGIKSLLPPAKTWRGAYTGSGNSPSTWTLRGQGTLFPDRLRIPVKWTITYAASISSGVGSQLSIQANSLADPGGASASTQPYGYDVLVTAYARYRVLAAAIEIRPISNANDSGLTTPAAQTSFTLWPSLTSTGYASDPEGAHQQPFAKRFLMNTAVVPAENCLRSYMSTAKMFGTNPLAPQVDDTYAALVAATPGRVWYYNILTESTNSSAATTSNPIIAITLIQYVEMYARQSLSST